MFNFLKKKQERVESQLETSQNETVADENLANILGAEENDTNITAGVDAILDDEAEISETQAEINPDNIDFNYYNTGHEVEEASEVSYEQPAQDWSENQPAEEQAEPLEDILNLDEASEPVTDIDNLTDNAEQSFYDYVENNQTESSEIFENITDVPDISDITDFSDIQDAPDISDITEPAPTSSFENFANESQENIPETIEDNAELSYPPEVNLPEIEQPNDSFSDIAPEFSEDNMAEDNLSFEEPTLEEPTVEEPSLPVEEIVMTSVTDNYQAQERELTEVYKVIPDNDLWQMGTLDGLSDNPKVINKYNQQEIWGGDKYQTDLKLEVENEADLDKWSVVIMHHYSVPLKSDVSEIVIDKQPDVVRYASLMRQGAEKLKIFNQSNYKFIMPQNDFFTVRGNVICGRVEATDVLDVLDYVPISLHDKINQLIQFKAPVSGFILGPEGTKVYFAEVSALAVCVSEIYTDDIISEYIPSLKDFDNRQSFVYGDQSEDTEFRATEQQNKLVINVGSSLYGWNIRFDNEIFMSLRDVLDYQAQYKKLPSENGDIIHGNKNFRFYGVKKIQAREKTVYYSYGRV